MNTTDRDREEAMEFASGVFQTFTTAAGRHPVDLVLKRDARIRSEAKAEAQAEIDALKREIDLCYSMWTGRNYGHLPLHEALGKAMADHETEVLSEAAKRVEKYMDGHHPPHYYSIGVHGALMGYSDGAVPGCSWRFDGDLWASECGLSWEFPERGPKENGVRYCPKCGKTVRDADEPKKED